tara:strand:- start:155 stop:1006 length:852 start_codon:yes stop_codon:yes gene_type:complete
MNDGLTEENTKSPGPRRVLLGCGLLVVLVVVGLMALDLIIKRVIADKIGDELAKKGWQVEVGKFDYSLWSKEIEIHDLNGVSLNHKQIQQFGQVGLEHVRLIYDGSRDTKIGGMSIRGFKSKIGRIDKMEVTPDKSIRIKGWTINNPAEFGGGPLIDVKEVNVQYAPVSQEANKRFKQIVLDVSRINIVKNQNGQWLTDSIPRLQVELQRMQSKKSEVDMPEVDRLTIKIGAIAFQDLGQSGQVKVVNVNQTIEENDNPKGYALGVFLRVIGVIAGAKNEADL